MKQLKWIVVFLVFYSNLNAQIKDEDYYFDLSKALGYCYGIELSNDLIQEKFSDLAPKAMMAQLEFNLAHKRSVDVMESEIASYLEVTRSEFRDHVKSNAFSKLDIESFSYSEAKAFLKNFEDERIFGRHELYKEFVQTLLIHNPGYKNYPLNEFIDEYRDKLSSSNHPKSKGLDLSLEYPLSWSLQEGKRPNVLSLVRSNDKSCSFSIIIKDIFTMVGVEKSSLNREDQEYFLSGQFGKEFFDEEINYSYGKKMMAGMGFEDYSSFSFDKTKIDGQKAAVIKATGVLNRGGEDLRLHSINYIILYKNYMINLGFMINSFENNLYKEQKKYEVLCELIATSMIFVDKWRD